MIPLLVIIWGDLNNSGRVNKINQIIKNRATMKTVKELLQDYHRLVRTRCYLLQMVFRNRPIPYKTGFFTNMLL